MTHFGPAPPTVPLTNSVFDTADPAIPAWLEQLQDEWVDPTGFFHLWRPNRKKMFPPLYTKEGGGRQPLWCNGQGRPRQGQFVRGGLICKVSSFSDRLCVPCTAARAEILRRLHDSTLAGHCGRRKNAARVHERFYWGGMWGDIHHFVLSCLTCQRVIGTPKL